jgi:hypothetical protein
MSEPIDTHKMSLNGEVVEGDVEYDGRIVFYIIKGAFS